MIKSFFLLLLIFVGLFAAAQNKNATIKKVEIDSTFRNFSEDYKLEVQGRTIITSPHLDSLIEKYRKDQRDASKTAKYDYSFSNPVKLPDDIFNGLSVKDKFVYAFKYPERYTQNCSYYSFDRYNAPFLHAALPFVTEGSVMSERQYKSLSLFRNNTISYLNEIIKESNNINNEYKQTIVKLNAFECIPALMLKYDTGKIKDNYILTTGVLLMKNDSFPPFINSSIYAQLYNEKNNWRKKIDLTYSLKQTVVGLINKYYLWKQGK